jgi:hypothetical protein
VTRTCRPRRLRTPFRPAAWRNRDRRRLSRRVRADRQHRRNLGRQRCRSPRGPCLDDSEHVVPGLNPLLVFTLRRCCS